MTRRTNIVWRIVLAVWIAACIVFFLGYYPYHFHYQAQNQLFLWSGDYLATYFSKPAWLACMAGDFLTQFYYYRYAGPIILTVCIALVGIFYRWSLRRTGMSGAVAGIVAFLIMAGVTVCSFRYDFWLSSVLALLGAAIVYLLTPIKKRFSFIGWFVAVPIVFWLFGYGVFAYVALVIVSAITSRRQIFICALATMIPLACLSITKRWYLLDIDKLYSYPGTGKFELPSMKLEKAFGVASEYQFGNYNTVARMVEAETHPLEIHDYYYNLVLAQKGQLADKLLRETGNMLGTFHRIGSESPQWLIQGMDELYWLLGDMTFCERAAILGNTFSPSNRNIAKIKRLAEVNIVTGDSLAANKYLGLLRKTFVYRDWAGRIMAKDKESLKPYLDKRAFTNKKDTLRTTDHAHVILTELLESNPRNDIALQYLLCSDLLARDISTFWKDYHKYYRPYKGRAPEVYQQALCIALAAQHASAEDYQRIGIDQKVFQQFAEYNNARGSDQYRGTYWYFVDKSHTDSHGSKTDF